jgi:ABC-type Zn uptake system ZnuABC Zn-binding protein ZnuA
MTLKQIGILVVGGIAAASLVQPLRADDAEALVLTGTQATYSLTVALLENTAVQVQNVPPDGRQLGLLKDYIARRTDALAPTFAAATAVVTLTNALPGDPLYRFAREANIRIVDIEAAVPWSIDAPGVALADAPSSTVEWGGEEAETAVAPYFWLSVSNSIRMGDIIARDLTALFPDSAATIGANLEKLKRALLDMRGDYQDRLIASGADVVFALTGDFVYLTNDMGLYVDGYFIKQDVHWTEADLAMLTQHLREHGIKVVLHEWMPSEAIQAAVREGGAKLVVLEAGDPGVVVERALAPDGLQQILRRNLDAVVAAAE